MLVAEDWKARSEASLPLLFWIRNPTGYSRSNTTKSQWRLVHRLRFIWLKLAQRKECPRSIRGPVMSHFPFLYRPSFIFPVPSTGNAELEYPQMSHLTRHKFTRTNQSHPPASTWTQFIDLWKWITDLRRRVWSNKSAPRTAPTKMCGAGALAMYCDQLLNFKCCTRSIRMRLIWLAFACFFSTPMAVYE